MPINEAELSRLANEYYAADVAYSAERQKSSINPYAHLYSSKREYLVNLKHIDLNGWFVQSRLARLVKSEVDKNQNLSNDEKEATTKKMLKKANSHAIRQAPRNLFQLIQRPIWGAFVYVLSFFLPLECVNVQKRDMQHKLELYAGDLKQAKSAADGAYNAQSAAKKAFKAFIMNALAEGHTASELRYAITGKIKDLNNGQPINPTPGMIFDRINYYASKYHIHRGFYPMMNKHMESAQDTVKSAVNSTIQRCSVRCGF